jgi:uncharacterized protein (TIGR02246 family)
MSTPSAFEDRFAIHELIHQWSAAVNERDWDGLASVYAEDGVIDVGPPFAIRLEGRQAIRETFSKMIPEQQYIIQTASAIVVKLNGDTASARATIHELMRGPDGTGMQQMGTYYDDLVRTAEGWKFKLRRFRVTIFDGKPPAGDFLKTYGEIG